MYCLLLLNMPWMELSTCHSICENSVIMVPVPSIFGLLTILYLAPPSKRNFALVRSYYVQSAMHKLNTDQRFARDEESWIGFYLDLPIWIS